MTIYVLILIEDSYILDEFATLNKEEADSKQAQWIEEHELDPETGMNGDESITGFYRTYEV